MTRTTGVGKLLLQKPYPTGVFGEYYLSLPFWMQIELLWFPSFAWVYLNDISTWFQRMHIKETLDWMLKKDVKAAEEVGCSHRRLFASKR